MEARENDLGTTPGFITGTAVVRDKDGNVKGTFTFGGPATPAQAVELGLIPKDPSET